MDYFTSTGRYRRKGGSSGRLLSISADAKTAKGEASGYLTGILYLAPERLAGIGNVCPFATEGCAAACLNTAGRGRFSQIQEARIRKTRAYYGDRPGFMRALWQDVLYLRIEAYRKGLLPAVRLNGTSDIDWQRLATLEYGTHYDLFSTHSEVQFYDYTKDMGRYMRFLDARRYKRFAETWPSNYHLAYSLSETPGELEAAKDILSRRGTVAVVLDVPKGDPMPDRWQGFPVHDGDLTDLRFTDPPGHWIAVRPKGRARTDQSGFVRRIDHA